MIRHTIARRRRSPNGARPAQFSLHSVSSAFGKRLFKRLYRRVSSTITLPQTSQCSALSGCSSVFAHLLRRSRICCCAIIMPLPSSQPACGDPSLSKSTDTNATASASIIISKSTDPPAASSSDKAVTATTPASDIVPIPKLRSVPAPAVAKTGPSRVTAPAVPSSAVVDVDADWCDTSPLNHSALMRGVLADIESPPNELDCPAAASSAAAAATAPVPVRDAPPRGLPISSLRQHWHACATPVTTVTTQFLQLEGLKRRVDVSVLRATEMRGRGTDDDSQWCRGSFSRFTEVHKGYYSIPVSLKCDHSFLEQPGDAIYIEQMCSYLFSDSEGLPPICTDARLYEVIVTADKAKIQRHQLMWAILIMKNRIVTFEDFFTSRRSMADVSKAIVSDSETDPLLCIPWVFFPAGPKWLLESVDLRSAHVSPIRALTFFAQTARSAGVKVFQRWNKSLQVELAIHAAVAHYTAWARPVIDQSRIWYPEGAHVAWLKRFAHLPPIPVYYESCGKYVTVTIREVVTILEDTLARATPQHRKDYRTKTFVKFVATPNALVYTLDPLREATLKPVTAVLPAPSQPRVPTPAPVTKPSSSTVLSIKGVMTGRIIKRESLRKNTRMTAELLNGLRGNGPWCASDIIDRLVANDEHLSSTNQRLTTEVTQLRQDMQRLRDDMSRYREDAARLGDELRTLRDTQNANNYNAPDTRRYDDANRGYASRGYYDPYERSY